MSILFQAGATDYYTGSPALGGQSAHTVSAWYYPTTPTDGVIMSITASSSGGGSPGDNRVQLSHEFGDLHWLECANFQIQKYEYTQGGVPSNTWVHVALVFEGGTNVTPGTVRSYRDGALQDTSTFLPENNRGTLNQLTIGRDLTGNVGAVTTYDRALTSAEIASLYRLQRYSAPYAQWPLFADSPTLDISGKFPLTNAGTAGARGTASLPVGYEGSRPRLVYSAPSTNALAGSAGTLTSSTGDLGTAVPLLAASGSITSGTGALLQAQALAGSAGSVWGVAGALTGGTPVPVIGTNAGSRISRRYQGALTSRRGLRR